jgi:hypothetical protein
MKLKKYQLKKFNKNPTLKNKIKKKSNNEKSLGTWAWTVSMYEPLKQSSCMQACQPMFIQNKPNVEG